MTIQNLPAYYGFTKMPFGKSLPPSDLYRHRSHWRASETVGGNPDGAFRPGVDVD